MTLNDAIEQAEKYPGTTCKDVERRLYRWPNTIPYSTIRYWMNKAYKTGKIRRGWTKWPHGCYAHHTYYPISSNDGEVSK